MSWSECCGCATAFSAACQRRMLIMSFNHKFIKYTSPFDESVIIYIYIYIYMRVSVCTYVCMYAYT